MKINEIQNLIRFIAKSGISEFELELKDFKIKINNPRPRNKIRSIETPLMTTGHQTARDTYQPATEEQTERTPAVKEAVIYPDESNHVTIKSPMIGSFYRRGCFCLRLYGGLINIRCY